jgi:hypothetical protein
MLMGMRKRTAGRFQVEALETRWTPGGAGGGVVLVCGAACHIGEEIPQVQVASVHAQTDALHGGVASAVQKVREAA